MGCRSHCVKSVLIKFTRMFDIYYLSLVVPVPGAIVITLTLYGLLLAGVSVYRGYCSYAGLSFATDQNTKAAMMASSISVVVILAITIIMVLWSVLQASRFYTYAKQRVVKLYGRLLVLGKNVARKKATAVALREGL